MKRRPTIDTRGTSSRSIGKAPKKGHLEFTIQKVRPGVWRIENSAEDNGKQVTADTLEQAYIAAAAIVHGVADDPAIRRAVCPADSLEALEAEQLSLRQAAEKAAAAAKKRKPGPSSLPSISRLLAAIRQTAETGAEPATA